MKTNQLQKNNKNEWKEIPVGDIFSFIKTYAISRDNLSTGIVSDNDIGNIHYGDIHSTYTSTNIDLSKTKIPLIKDKSFKPKKEELLKDGDLVMADASEDYEGISVTVSVHGIGNKKIVGGLHTYVLRDEKGITDEYYRQYIFRNPKLRNKLQKIANGVSVYGVPKTTLAKVLLSISSLGEQNRIVSVLETWDKSIENLNKKIEIKKQIKKGLMQDLLTGKKRLSGFKDKWITVTVGDVSDFINGYTFKSGSYVDNGKYKIITIANVQDGFMFINEPKIINELPLNINKEQILKKGDILISMTGNVGRVCVVDNDNCLLNQRVGKIIAKGINKDLLYLFLYDRKFLYQMIGSAQGGAQANLSTEDIKEYIFDIPKIKEEQNVIANILTTADKEIAELEKKLLIIKDQKKYLLNNLITGVIRTPENLSIKL